MCVRERAREVAQCDCRKEEKHRIYGQKGKRMRLSYFKPTNVIKSRAVGNENECVTILNVCARIYFRRLGCNISF